MGSYQLYSKVLSSQILHSYKCVNPVLDIIVHFKVFVLGSNNLLYNSLLYIESEFTWVNSARHNLDQHQLKDKKCSSPQCLAIFDRKVDSEDMDSKSCSLHYIIISILKSLKKLMNDLPITGKFRKQLKTLSNSSSSAKTWTPCLEYKIPFKNYVTDQKLTYMLKLAKHSQLN